MAKAGQGRFLLALLLFLGLTVLGSSAAESFPIKAIKRFSLFQHPEYFMMVRGGQPFWVGSGSGSEETKRAALSPEGPPGERGPAFAVSLTGVDLPPKKCPTPL